MEAILLIIALIFSIVIHELSHGLAADQLGDPTARYAGRLTLNPLSHLDPIGSFLVPLLTFFGGGFIFGWAKPVPYNPLNLKNPRRDSVLVALAGPASNIILAIVLIIFYKFFALLLPLASQTFFLSVIRLNLGLAIFNLIPIPPLDGSRIFLSLLPFQVQAALEIYGIFLLLIFIMFFSGIVITIVNTLMKLLLQFGG